MQIIEEVAAQYGFAALMQEKDGVLHPISFISQALDDHEVGYGISDKEGAAATWAQILSRYSENEAASETKKTIQPSSPALSDITCS